MYKDLRANLYYFVADIRFSVVVFWSIFIASIVVLYFLGMTTSANIIVSPSFAVYIFCGISGFVMTRESFPFCIKMGSTRGGYLLTAFLFLITQAIFMSLLQLGISGVITFLIDLGNVSSLHFYHSITVTNLESTWYNQLLIDVLLNILVLFLGFLLGSIFYRFGLIGGVTTLAIVGILIIIPVLQEPILELFASIEGKGLNLKYVNILLLSLLSFIPTWFFLRRASTIPGATR